MKNSNDTFGNRARNIPPPRALTNYGFCSNTKNLSTLWKLLGERFALVKLKQWHTQSVLSVWMVIS